MFGDDAEKVIGFLSRRGYPDRSGQVRGEGAKARRLERAPEPPLFQGFSVLSKNSLIAARDGSMESS
jgi:hypothetical protein